MRLLKEKTDVIAKKCMGVTTNVSETSLREIEDIFYDRISKNLLDSGCTVYPLYTRFFYSRICLFAVFFSKVFFSADLKKTADG